MCQNDIKIRLVDTWPVDELVLLYKAAGWWKEHYKPDGISQLIEGSFAFAVAIDGKTGKAVGMGRAISDGVSDAYIQDVVVFEEMRGQNIGGRIIKTLADHCLKNKLAWIGLIAEQDSSPFYEKLGFSKFQGEPMIYRMEDG